MELVLRVMTYFHGPAFMGHFGRDRMIRRIQTRFYMLKVKEAVSAYLEKCVHCRLENMPRLQRVKRTLAPLVLVRKFEIVGVDVISVSPASIRGNSKVLVLASLSSRYVVRLLLHDESADSVAAAMLEGWTCRLGAYEKILSDPGPAFAGEVVSALCDLLGVKRLFTSAYRPQGNGAGERYNRTLCSQVRARILSDDTQWDKHLAAATYAFNTSIHDTTKVSPFHAMFGTPTPELDRDILFVSEEQAAAEVDIEGSIKRSEKFIPANVGARRAQVQRWCYVKAADSVFVPGRPVILFDPPASMGLGRKLRYPWRGLYVILEDM